MEEVKATNINQLMELGANVYEGKYLGNKVFFIRFKYEVELNGIVGNKFATGGLMRNGYKQISFGGKREGL